MVLWLIILGIIGLLLLTKGADWLVDSSADFARYLKVSPILVGLTIVAFGTSLPEFVVSFFSTLSGNYDIAIGNIVGSNIANIGLILGIAALLYPLAVKSSTLMYEFPFLLVSAFLFVILANDRNLLNADTITLSWIDGLIFLFAFALFLIYIFKAGRMQRDSSNKQFLERYQHKNPVWKDLTFILIGLAMLFFGGRFFVSSLTGLTQALNISEKFIGLTIAAVGTSMPELFTSAVAAYKKQADIAIGNIVGSNIFNILFILGITSVVKNIIVNPVMLYFDSIIMILFTFVLVLFATTGKRITRPEGAVLLIGYMGYVVYLAVHL